MPNETTDVSVVVPATKIGPPEPPKQVPPVWFTPRLLENFAAMPFPAPNPVQVDQLLVRRAPGVGADGRVRPGVLEAVPGQCTAASGPGSASPAGGGGAV